jgi:hypothetical protein
MERIMRYVALIFLVLLVLVLALPQTGEAAPGDPGACLQAGSSDKMEFSCTLVDIVPRPGIAGGSSVLCLHDGEVTPRRYTYVHMLEECTNYRDGRGTKFQRGLYSGAFVDVRGTVMYGTGYWDAWYPGRWPTHPTEYGNFVADRVRFAR